VSRCTRTDTRQIRLCIVTGQKVDCVMQASEVIQKIRRLPNTAAQEVYEFLFSAKSEAEWRLDAFARLTEEEILALPRARHAR